jgi:prevent-host-death family protein
MKDISYGVRELQANLGDALRAAERGDRVIITSRGRPVAILAAVDARLKGESAGERKLRRLAAQGRIRLGARGAIPDYKAPSLAGGLSAQLEADRR